MTALTLAAFACLAAVAAAAPSGLGVVVSGPSGVVTDHGPVGPHGSEWDDGRWDDGRWDDGRWDDGRWDDGRWDRNVVLAKSATLVGPAVGHAALVGPSAGHATLIGPSAGHADIVGPSALGHGLGGLGVVVGRGWGGLGLAHGVVVKGPPTVPATIVGPAGKVQADGLWGPTLALGHGKW